MKSMKWKITQRISEIKNWFFEEINKIDESLAKLIKRKTQINKIRDEKVDTAN
jgi:hypothetical protein